MFSMKFRVATIGSVCVMTIRKNSYQFYLMSLDNSENGSVRFMLRRVGDQMIFDGSSGSVELSELCGFIYEGPARISAQMCDNQIVEICVEAPELEEETLPQIRL